MLSHWLSRRWPRPSRPGTPLPTSRRRSVRLSVEQLEDRLAPAVIFEVDRLDDPSAWDIIGDDSNAKTFFGTPFVAYYTDGIPTFEMIDDVSIPDGAEIQAVSPGLPIIIVVPGNLTLGENVFINFAGNGATPGPGGGAGGTAGAGGAGGLGVPGGAGGIGGTGQEAGIGKPLATNGGFGVVPDPASGDMGSRGGEGGAGGNGFNEGFSGRGGNSPFASNPGATAADSGGIAGLVFGGNGGDALYRTNQNGGAGGAGAPGWIGFNIPSDPDLLSGGGGGGGGAGGVGGSGGSGGAGGGGGAGATLGSDPSSPLNLGVDGGDGGGGGAGGRGGNGANGITGGDGGGGGGAFKILVDGTLVVGAGSILSVQGGDGVVRDPLVVRPGEKLDPFNVTDMYGQPGSPGTFGPGSQPSLGGAGGDGARGGDGGDGGAGGSGAGGAGGTIWLEAAAIEFGDNVTFNIRGGSGGNISDSDGWLGGEGRLIVNAASVTGNATVFHNGESFPLDETVAPTITSASSDTFTAGMSDSFTITTTGLPFAAITLEAGTLPDGIVFQDNGNGTAFLAGTPTSGGTFELTFQAANDEGSDTQVFTLTVEQAPAFTSVNSTTFEIGVFGSFDITTVGFPDPALSKLGALPAGITFTDNRDGTATLAGTPTEGGSFGLGLIAGNGVEPTASQGFTLTVNQPPAITSANQAAFTTGSAGSFLITTTGFPAASTISLAGLPAGLTLTNHGNGTATLAGTPAPGTSGVYNLQAVAGNGIDPDAVQPFTLTVNAANVSSKVRLLWPASFKNLGNQQFRVVFTIKNLGKQALSGPIQLTWPALPNGVTVVSSTSIASLAAGKSAQITVVFKNQSANPLANPKLHFNKVTAVLMTLFGDLNSPFKPIVLVG